MKTSEGVCAIGENYMKGYVWKISSSPSQWILNKVKS